MAYRASDLSIRTVQNASLSLWHRGEVRKLEVYFAVSLWLLSTLVPNFLVAWKKGGWYWRGTGRYAGRICAAGIWFLWILLANSVIYPLLEQGITSLYVLAGEPVFPVFVVIVAVWVYAFIWKGERTGEV
jgi:hypothetical protein